MDSTRRLKLLGNRKGFSLVYIALMISVLFGGLGLAVDVSHLYVVRGQLQNAADSAALAGAWSLYRDPTKPGELPSLDWNRAEAAARAFINLNKTDVTLLTEGTVEVGYWNLIAKILQPTTIIPTSQDIPAVRVTISRSAGNNGGPVSTFFMKVLDASKESAPVSSLPSVAMSDFPGSVSPGTLFPMALSKRMTDNIFSSPPATWPNQINLTSRDTGQWTSFKLGKNDVPTIRELMENGNPDTLAVGDDIWIEPGVEATLYQTKNWPFTIPVDVVLAIVDDTVDTSGLETKGPMTISGFATFHIDGAVATGNDKHIFGHFIAYYETYPPGTNPGGGTPSNIVTRPLMVQ